MVHMGVACLCVQSIRLIQVNSKFKKTINSILTKYFLKRERTRDLTFDTGA